MEKSTETKFCESKDAENCRRDSTYLKAAIEILMMPGGPSDDAVRAAIACLETYLDKKLGK